MTEDLYAIVGKLNEPIQPNDAPERVALCREALTRFERDDDPPLWADLHIILGSNLIRIPMGNSTERIVEVIDQYEQALQVYTREEYPKDWAFIHHKLAELHRTTASGPTDPKLVLATTHYQKALEGYTPEENANRWAMINANLALCYQLIDGGPAELEQTVYYYNEALKVYTLQNTPHQWAIVHHNLGDVHRRLSDLDPHDHEEQSLRHYERALQVYDQQQHPEEWASLQTKIADIYVNRHMGERIHNLEQAIHHYQLALQVRPYQAHPVLWANIMNNLASTYLLRIAGERKDNLEQALQGYQQTLAIFNSSEFPQTWAMVQNNMGEVYRNRIACDRATNLEEAIRCFNQALQVRKREINPEEWAMTQSNLGETYRYRIFGERTANIERSIDHFRQALDVLASGETWAKVQNNLAAAYRDRIAGRRSENLVQAIEHYSQALHTLTRQAYPLEWAITQQNIALAYNDLGFLNYEADSSSDKALWHCQQALEVLTPHNFPEDWAMTQVTLGSILANRRVGDRIKNLHLAEECFQQALNIYTFASIPEEWASVQNSLGCIYTDLVRYGQREHLEQAITALEGALRIRKIDRLPGQYQQTQRNLAELFFAEGRWGEAGEACQAAITAGINLLEASYTEIGRQAEVEAMSQLYARASYCFWQRNQIANALHHLDQGKTYLLGQALALGEINLDQLPAARKTTIRELRQGIRELEGEMRLADTSARRPDRELTDLLHQTRADLSQQIAAIRVDYPDFMPVGLDVPDILKLIPTDGALVAPCVTSQGSFVFVIPHVANEVTAAQIVSLPNLTTDTVQTWLRGADAALVGGWLGAYSELRRTQTDTELENWFTTINQTGRVLWEMLMGPVYQQLQVLKLANGAPVLLMPQGGLGLFPLHAAWREMDGVTRCFSDDYTVAYAPSGYALYISRQRAVQPDRQSRSLFAAINPTRDLTYTPVEGEAIRQFFAPASQTIVYEDEATAVAFPSLAKGHTYIHYSGHGYYHWRDPLQSGLQLADKPYTLADILSGLDLSNCRLVTLSACETGITEFQKAPDEYVGLPAGFLQAGAPAVISTLWAVNDLSTMLLMERFYQLHLQDGLEFAPALRQAQLWLRDITAGELVERFGEERMKLKGNRLTLSEAGQYWRRFAAMEPEERPFSHPYYWAAFTFTGA